jgi:hypothetical protein
MDLLDGRNGPALREGDAPENEALESMGSLPLVEPSFPESSDSEASASDMEAHPPEAEEGQLGIRVLLTPCIAGKGT